MTEIERLIHAVDRAPRCRVLPAAGTPNVRAEDVLPDDLREFYRLCGGVTLFDGADYGIAIVAPDGFLRTNPIVAGVEAPEDITDSWYVVAAADRSMVLSIDCHPARRGRCYDSFCDRHGVAGSCPIIALSFAEMLRRLIESLGDYWYWAASPTGYGDAYDPLV